MADNAVTEEELRLKAKARLLLQQKPAETSDVLTQAPIKGAAGIVDEVLNFPSNLKNLGKMASEIYVDPETGMNSTMGGPIPADYGQFDIPENTATNYLTEQGFIDPKLRDRMSPEQKMADTAIQAAVGGLAGGTAKQAIIGGLAAGAGQGVTEATGSEAAGLATSILTPVAGSKIKALNTARDEAIRLNSLRDETNREAQDLGMIVVPDSRIADFANRPKLLQTAVDINQKVTNSVARASLGLPKDQPISRDTLEKLRKGAYQNGYEPIKRSGRVTMDNDFLNDLSAVEAQHAGQFGSFPDDVSPKLKELVDAYLVPDADAADMIDKIRTLRKRATKNINSDVPDNEEYGFAQQAIADAMEAQLERHLVLNNAPPELMDNYRAARKLIARSHTVESALTPASGDINALKWAKMFEKNLPIDGDVKKVAKFASINKPRANPNKEQNTPYSHLAGAGLAMGAAQAMDLPYWTYGPLAAAGAWTGREAHNALASPTRAFLTSRTGQSMMEPDYNSLGIDPRQGALSGLMFENANGDM